MQYHAYFWELERVSYLTSWYPINCYKNIRFFLIWYFKWWQCSFRRLLLLQYPQFSQPLNFFDEGILCIFGTGKAWPWCGVVHPFTWKETSSVFQSPKLPSKSNSYEMRRCSYFFNNWHLDACNCLWQLTGDLLFLSLASSIWVAHLACVLIGSLAKLLFSFCAWSVLVPCRWLILSSAMWSHQWLSAWLPKSIMNPNSFMV